MAPRADLPPADPDGVIQAILTANHTLVQLSVQALGELAPQLSLSEFRVLGMLSHQGPQRLIDIATALDVTPTTVTRLADRLTDRGLVGRARLSGDRREVYLSVTPAGRSLVGEVSAEQRRFVAAVLGEFPEQDRAVALSLVGRLAGSPRALRDRTA